MSLPALNSSKDSTPSPLESNRLVELPRFEAVSGQPAVHAIKERLEDILFVGDQRTCLV